MAPAYANPGVGRPPLSTPWLHRFCPMRSPRLRLFMFSYAGGNAMAYRHWQNDVAADIEVVGIQLPGRLSRLQEPPITDFNTLVAAIAEALVPMLDVPCVFFGHSLGGIVSFEVARLLRARGDERLLRALIVSACAAPHLRAADPRLYALPDAKFIDKLREMNGTPSEILASRELMDLVMPALRADFFLAGTYRYQPAQYGADLPFDMPIHVFAGERDGWRGDGVGGVSEKQLRGWQAYTTAQPFSLSVFPGDHFFIHSSYKHVIATLNALLGKTMDELKAPMKMTMARRIDTDSPEVRQGDLGGHTRRTQQAAF